MSETEIHINGHTNSNELIYIGEIQLTKCDLHTSEELDHRYVKSYSWKAKNCTPKITNAKGEYGNTVNRPSAVWPYERCHSILRLKSGSDNRRGSCRDRTPPSQCNACQGTTAFRSILGSEMNKLPSVKHAYRERNADANASARTSRAPVPVNCQPEPARAGCQLAESCQGSRLSDQRKFGAKKHSAQSVCNNHKTPAANRSKERRCTFNLPDEQPSTAELKCSRRETYDAPKPMAAVSKCDRCDTYNAPKPTAASKCGRRDTCDEPKCGRRDTCDARKSTATPKCGRRDTCDAPKSTATPKCGRRDTCNARKPTATPKRGRRDTCDEPKSTAGPRYSRRGTYDVPKPNVSNKCDVCNTSHEISKINGRLDQNSRDGGVTIPFTMTGTIKMNNYGGGNSQQTAPPTTTAEQPRQQCSANMSGTIEDYLDNHMNVDMIAPRALAVPGCPYVHIDENADPPTPESWRQMLSNRSSLDSRPRSMDTSPYRRNERSESANGSNDWSDRSAVPGSDYYCDGDPQPFRPDDSFVMATPKNAHRSRAVSLDGNCPASDGIARRRNTFERKSR